MFTTKLAASRSARRGTAADGMSDDWEFTSAADDTPEQLYALWDGAVERSRARLDAALADGGLDQLVHMAWPGRSPRQPAPAGLRPDRGVRPAHRPRRPAPRSSRRTGGRGPAARLASPLRPFGLTDPTQGGGVGAPPCDRRRRTRPDAVFTATLATRPACSAPRFVFSNAAAPRRTPCREWRSPAPRRGSPGPEAPAWPGRRPPPRADDGHGDPLRAATNEPNDFVGFGAMVGV